MSKRLSLLVCLGLVLVLAGPGTVLGGVLDLRITEGGNDAEQHLGDGSMDIGSGDIEFPYEDNAEPAATDEQVTALRFVSVPLPKGAKITKAYVEFEVDETKGGTKPVNVIIEGQLVPNAPAIANVANGITSISPRTAAQVKWAVPEWTKNDVKWQSSDISAVIQEIVNQDGWAGGNALLLIIRDDKDAPSTGVRCAESVDGEATAAPLLHIEAFVGQATQPVPADGAVEVTSPLMQWTAGDSASFHKVYVGTSPELGPADLVAPASPVAMYFHAPGFTPGVTYYWRVDEVEVDGVTTHTGNVWSLTTMPLTAHFVSPADGATEVGVGTKLSWTAGMGAVSHVVYLSTDKAAVAAGDAAASVGTIAETSFDPNGLLGFATYYWRVDEVDATGAVVAGPVLSFSTVSYLPISETEVTLNYDNSAAPFLSQMALDAPADWTVNGITDLSLQFLGAPAPKGSAAFDEATGTYTVTGEGADVWGSSDQFQYAYASLTGDGSIQARVVSNGTGSNLWAKGGLMIRSTLAANSPHMIMALTGGEGGGIGFQGRQTVGGNSSSFHGDVTAAPPYWVKLTREGNSITGSYSADGVAWQPMADTSPDNAGFPMSNPVIVEMPETVYIGLFVTSHAAGQLRSFTFDNVTCTGNVAPAGPFAASKDVGLPGNTVQPLYAAVEDSAGAIATVSFADPAASQITQWWTWRIPLSALTGVDLKNVAKVHLGVGNPAAPVADGLGTVKFRNVRVVKPLTLPAIGAAPVDVTSPGDNVRGVPNDGDWPAAEPPWLAVDNSVNTKFLHFKGETQPTGFQVEVMAGSTIVTGLTFTTANDAPERDPVSFELSGSNDGIGGPYTLIASGSIADFAGETAWPRFTQNATAIAFENAVAYKYYQVMFPAVRDPTKANSMQIAEVELLGTGTAAPPKILWVSFHGADDVPSAGAAGVGFTEAVDKGYTDLLKANGYNVVRYIQTKTPDLAVVNAADLVIISRSVASGSFQNDAATTWNLVTAPMIVLNGYTARKSRMGYFTGSSMQDITGDITLTANNPTHPIFAGIALTDGTMTNPFAGLAVYPTDNTKAAGISFVADPANDQGTVLATLSAASGTVPAGSVAIAEWPAGATLTHDGGAGTDTLAGHRLVFLTGARENGGKSSETAGMYDLYPDGAQMFLNAVAYMLQ